MNTKREMTALAKLVAAKLGAKLLQLESRNYIMLSIRFRNHVADVVRVSEY